MIFSNPEVMRYWSTPPLADRASAARSRTRSFMGWSDASGLDRHEVEYGAVPLLLPWR
jgi:hypothetical protein